MLNIFKKFKKGEGDISGQEKGIKDINKENEDGNKAMEAKDYDEQVDAGVAIHTMPKKFLLDNKQVKKAKTAGLIIIISGAIFIIISSILIYFYLIRGPVENNLSSKLNDSNKEDDAGKAEEGGEVEKEDSSIGSKDLESATNTERSLEIPPLKNIDTSTATSTPGQDLEPKATSTPADVITLRDNDKDGLTDAEEALLGSLSNSLDSDSDGYDDLMEVINLFNPVGKDKLINNPKIREYINKTFEYSLLYPASWSKNIVGGDDSVMFKSSNNHLLQVIVQPNADKQSINDWYLEQFNVEYIDDEKIISTDTWQGIRGEDELTDSIVVYLIDNNKEYIFVLSYVASSNDNLIFRNIFEVMVKSFVIGG
ncbi:MAG: hypothetical protein ABIE43_04170 [Patescibacteria group bacterium]